MACNRGMRGRYAKHLRGFPLGLNRTSLQLGHSVRSSYGPTKQTQLLTQQSYDLRLRLVSNGLESGQESDMFLDSFQSAVAGIWENLWKLVEGPVCEMVLHFESIGSEKGEVGFA